MTGLTTAFSVWLRDLEVEILTLPEVCVSHAYLLLGVLSDNQPITELLLRNNFQPLSLNPQCTRELGNF